MMRGRKKGRDGDGRVREGRKEGMDGEKEGREGW